MHVHNLTRAVAAEPASVLPGVRPFAPVVARLLDEQGPVPVRSFTVHDVLGTPGRPLTDPVRAEMEQRLGADFSDVRVHTDEAAHASAQDMNALAYTSGSHIVFQAGRYDGASAAGKRTLAHELTHVIQQRHGPVPGTCTGDGYALSDPRDSFERAAEVNAQRVMARPLHAMPAAGPAAVRPAPAEPAAARPAAAACSTPVPAGPGPGGGTVSVQRQLVDKHGTPQTYLSLSKNASVQKAAAAARKVIEWWADDLGSPRVQYNNLLDLVTQAKATANDPPAAFISWLDSDGLNDLISFTANAPLTPQQQQDIAVRRGVLANTAIAAFGPNPHLHLPVHDPRYQIPPSGSDKPLERTGRGGGEFIPRDNKVVGLLAKQTGSVNQELAKEQIAAGNWEKVGDTHMQMCPGCAFPQDVNAFQVDHQQALSHIRNSLWLLADAMSYSQQLHNNVEKNTPDFAKFFQVTPPTIKTKPLPDVTPTAAALSAFSNDMGNLARICGICNGAVGKSATDILQWYKKNPFFGPTFVDENSPTVATGDLMLRTRHNTGWGEAARKWFEAHHIPVLKQGFAVARLQQNVMTGLGRESRSATKAKFEPDFVKKRKHEEETTSLARNNKVFVGASEKLADYMELGPAPFAPNSPERFADELGEQIKQREERKEREAAEASSPFMEGWIDGREGFKYNLAYLSMADTNRYKMGYLEGKREAADQRERGYEDALKDPPRKPDAGATNAYRTGFRRATENRNTARQIGYEDGSASTPPDPTKIPKGDPGEAVFLRDYMAGYSKAMLDLAKAGQPAPQGPGQGV